MEYDRECLCVGSYKQNEQISMASLLSSLEMLLGCSPQFLTMKKIICVYENPMVLFNKTIRMISLSTPQQENPFVIVQTPKW